MECLCARGTVRCGFEEQWSCIHVQSKHIPFGQSFMAPRNLGFLGHSSLSKSRSYAIPGVKFPSLHFHREKQSRGSISAYVNVDDVAHLSIPEEPSEELLPQKPDSDQLKALLIDSERRRLIKKLSEANQHNRFLKRQLQAKDDDLVEIKSELAILELEIEEHEGYPSGSMVDFACDHDGSPILVVSSLAVHTKNLLANPKCSLLVAKDPEDRTDLVVTVYGDAISLDSGALMEPL